ncbi:MAG: hypothetical protein AAGD22_04785 [Verrucomicrobiota bacterium]
MLRQTIRHRIVSRITFYFCVITLLWLMDKATQAYHQSLPQDPAAQQIHQIMGTIAR